MNKFYFFVALMIISAMIGCAADKESVKTTDQNNNTTTAAPAPDNTARNERDRNTQAVTPPDQLENSTDLQVTQQIRKSIMDDSSLSTNAKNIKIITQEHEVTLRGVVNSTTEKQKIENIAKQVVHTTKNVHNKLEVKSRS